MGRTHPPACGPARRSLRESASQRITLIDGLRTDLLRRMGWDDDDQKLYDPILDTSGLTVDACVDAIADRLASDEREQAFEPAMRPHGRSAIAAGRVSRGP
ncbi:MAG: hypothetical protein M5U09_03730 [Gammaproteobacteria bacterium]|nr:hypothetical protein [Gammaproteobacteria bacterium]